MIINRLLIWYYTYPKQAPLKIKSGSYTDKQLKDLLRILSQAPGARVQGNPHLVTTLNKASNLNAGAFKFSDLTINTPCGALWVKGKSENTKTKQSLKVSYALELQKSQVLVKDNVAFIFTINKHN